MRPLLKYNRAGGCRGIVTRSIFKRLDADVGKREIHARKIGQLTDGKVSQALFKENCSLLYLFQYNLSGDSASLEKEVKEKHCLRDDVKINFRFQAVHISVVLFICDNKACKVLPIEFPVQLFYN